MPHQNDYDVLVAGGGLAGLASAVALSDSGLRVAVLEASAQFGGRARSWVHTASGDVVDIGPHVIGSDYKNFRAFLRRLGTDKEILWQPSKMLTLATRPLAFELRHCKLLPSPLSLVPSFLRAPGLSLRDKLSNRRVTIKALNYSEAKGAKLDSTNALELLQHCKTSPAMIDWFWRMASMTVMNVPLELSSAASLLRIHAMTLRSSRPHFGFARVGLSELYVRQAISIIVARGGAAHTNAHVVRRDWKKGAHVVYLANGSQFTARDLVLALPPAELGTLDADLLDTTRFKPSPYISVVLWFDRPLTCERSWVLMWSRDRLNYDFYDLTNIRSALRNRPAIIASNIIYSHRASLLSDEEIVAATIKEIGLFAPAVSDARLLHSDVHRIPMAIPCPHPGFEMSRPTTIQRGGSGSGKVFLAGDWIQTHLPCSMESAVTSGLMAAEEVRRHRQSPHSNPA